MNRLYSVESSPTLTGAKADHRLTLKASDIEAFARALASAAGASAPGGGDAGRSWTADEQKWIGAVAKDLAAHRGRSLIVAGEYQPPAVHAIARSLNEAEATAGTSLSVRASAPLRSGSTLRTAPESAPSSPIRRQPMRELRSIAARRL